MRTNRKMIINCDDLESMHQIKCYLWGCIWLKKQVVDINTPLHQIIIYLDDSNPQTVKQIRTSLLDNFGSDNENYYNIIQSIKITNHKYSYDN